MLLGTDISEVLGPQLLFKELLIYLTTLRDTVEYQLRTQDLGPTLPGFAFLCCRSLTLGKILKSISAE